MKNPQYFVKPSITQIAWCIFGFLWMPANTPKLRWAMTWRATVTATSLPGWSSIILGCGIYHFEKLLETINNCA